MSDTAIRAFPAQSDGGPARNGAVGLVALATDHVCELDLRQVIPQDRWPLYVSRIALAPEITVATLGAMRDGITAAAELILAGGRIDVIAYGCTSGTMVIGEDEVFARLRAARPGVACTTPPTAALAALLALKLGRIAVLTPYTEGVNRLVRGYLTERGHQQPGLGLARVAARRPYGPYRRFRASAPSLGRDTHIPGEGPNRYATQLDRLAAASSVMIRRAVSHRPR